MATVTYLVDKSAWGLRDRSPHACARLADLIEQGQAATCQLITLELCYSAQNTRDYDQHREWLAMLAHYPTTGETLDRAVQIQHQLATAGQHRRPLPDLIIAATAEQHGLTVLHYDADFDLIATVTGHTTEWLMPRGSL